jgi:hypothetical protein
MLPSNATFLFRVPVFPECNSSPSATLGEDFFPECPIFGTRGSAWHSGKIASPVVGTPQRVFRIVFDLSCTLISLNK